MGCLAAGAREKALGSAATDGGLYGPIGAVELPKKQLSRSNPASRSRASSR